MNEDQQSQAGREESALTMAATLDASQLETRNSEPETRNLSIPAFAFLLLP